MNDTVETVAAARAGLSATLRDFRQHPSAHPVVIGSHRKAEAVIMPFAQYERLAAVPIEPEPVLLRLRRARELILRLAALSKIESIDVFGSVARGEETATSDVDLLLTTIAGVTFFDLSQFSLDVEQIVGRPVDVVTRSSLQTGSGVAKRILDEAVPL
jgi:predicted nucleotidyltransferase